MLVLLAISAPGRGVGAQAAATVPASSPIYRMLESVTAWFPDAGVPLGVRPLSQGTLSRVVERLTSRVEQDSTSDVRRRLWALRELAAMRDALAADSPHATVRASFAARVFSTSARTDTIESNGLGTLDAVSHPFGDLRQGWPAERGAVVTAAPVMGLGLRDRIALVAQPRVSIYSPPGSQDRAEIISHRLYARGVYRNVAVKIGADEALWGQSEAGALFISGNAAPLSAITIGTDEPFVLPWLFRLAGPVSLTAMVADLGRAQDPPHAKLAGWHATMQPWSRFELGVSVLAQQGGKGGPEATLVERFLDLFPLIDALAPQHADFEFSNKFAGGNLRLRIPEWSGLDIHYELLIDDFDLRRFESTVIDDFSHFLGVRLPLLFAGGELVLRAQMANTGLRVYEHAQFRSGLTYRDHLIGSPLGPNAKGAYLSADWHPVPTTSFGIVVADELRDPSLYASTASGPFDQGFVLVRQTDDPDHRRRRITATMSSAVPGGWVQLEAGYNRAWRTGSAGRGEYGLAVSFNKQVLPVF